MTIPTADNAQRVTDAHTALVAFGMTQTRGGFVYDLTDPEQFEELTGDLIANLMHAAKVAGVDWDHLVSVAERNFSAETTEPYDLL